MSLLEPPTIAETLAPLIENDQLPQNMAMSGNDAAHARLEYATAVLRDARAKIEELCSIVNALAPGRVKAEDYNAEIKVAFDDWL